MAESGVGLGKRVNEATLTILGRGAFGVVYKLDGTKALKVLHVGDDVKLKQLALSEVEFMVGIRREMGEGSDNILHLIGYDDLGDRVYVYMPLAESSMRAFINNPLLYTTVALSQKVDVLRQCFNGLHFLHSRHPPLIHQDIKPENILLFKGLTPKLCDFGLSRSKSHATATMLSDRGVGGTLPYMGPEVLVGVPGKGKLKPQPATDVYAMCCAGVEWLTGGNLWTYSGYEDIKKQIKKKLKNHQLPDQLQQVPKPWATILTQGLVHDHTQRPSAAAIRDSLAGTSGISSQNYGIGSFSSTTSTASAAPAVVQRPAQGAVTPYAATSYPVYPPGGYVPPPMPQGYNPYAQYSYPAQPQQQPIQYSAQHPMQQQPMQQQPMQQQPMQQPYGGYPPQGYQPYPQQPWPHQ